MKLGYLGIDQHGAHYHIKRYPRKELMAQLGNTHVRKQYTDYKDGSSKHSGYILGHIWVTVYEVHTWKE